MGEGFSSTMSVRLLTVRPSAKAASTATGTTRWSLGRVGAVSCTRSPASWMVRPPKTFVRISSQAGPALRGACNAREQASAARAMICK